MLSVWRLGLERPPIPTSSLIIPSAPAARNPSADVLFSSGASCSVTHLGWETFEENGAPVLVCQRAACGSLTDCRETWRRISPPRCATTENTHAFTSSYAAFAHNPRELPLPSNLGCIFEVNGHKNKSRSQFAILTGGDYIFAVFQSVWIFPKHMKTSSLF